ncbi:MAG TPA: winged helix-turn-helix domain-containing protein [Acidimicrobiia bacterium]
MRWRWRWPSSAGRPRRTGAPAWPGAARPACSWWRTAPTRPRRSTAWRAGCGPPAPEAELRARVGALLTRHRTHQRPVPHIDADGVLRFGSARVPLPPAEARLAGLLAEHFEAVVSREALRRAVWPDSAPARNVLDVHMVHLRRRLAGAGLKVRTLRTQGYLLEVGSGGSGPPESPRRRPPCLPFSSRGG